MNLDLHHDLVIHADRLSVINGLSVRSADGHQHRLRVLVPPGAACSDPATVTITNGMSADDQISVEILTTGRTQINGPLAANARLDTGCLAASGAITLNPPPLTPMNTP